MKIIFFMEVAAFSTPDFKNKYKQRTVFILYDSDGGILHTHGFKYSSNQPFGHTTCVTPSAFYLSLRIAHYVCVCVCVCWQAYLCGEYTPCK